MTKRLDKLKRIAAVQQKIVRHAEMRHAIAEKKCQDLIEDRARLQGYVCEQGGLGDTMSRAAMRSLQRLQTRLEEAQHERALTQDGLARAKRREHVAEEIETRVAKAEERANEDAELARLVETWLIGRDASLP